MNLINLFIKKEHYLFQKSLVEKKEKIKLLKVKRIIISPKIIRLNIRIGLDLTIFMAMEL
jgi:hypothetical protein